MDGATSIAGAGLGLARPDLLRQAAYIDGRWIATAAQIDVTSPASGARLGGVPDLGADAAERAVSAAQAAFGPWSRLSAKARGAILRRWRDLILENADDLARLMTAEQGKPLAEAKGEVLYAAGFLEWFAEEAKRVYGDIIPGHDAAKRLMVLKQPIGVVAAVTPWNFPAAMITRKVGPALAVGCTVVLKPSELTPFSALALALLGEEAGVPPGVFNVVTGQAAPIGEVLTGDPRVRKFTFTGSTPVGKMLAARCMATVKRVSLELGGNAPFIVFDDADLDKAVEGAMASKFRNTGQTCVCANRLLVQAGVYDAFADKLAARVERLVVGDGLAGPTDQGPLINAAAAAKVARHVEDAVAGGARVLTGGAALPGEGFFYAPTVLTGVTRHMLLANEETFGPVAGLIRFETEAEAIEIANDTSAGLAAYLFTRDLDRSWRVAEALEYGMVGLNTGLISTEVAPFGGVKESGLGREGSRHGVDEFVELKLLCSDIAGA
ncbi:NAD-dependent succinate-semialdehyde dehydrogenase [Caulobacter segnis]|uniref:Succinate-semialdehyde dehydrogenase (NADP(+)) n=1 Tax=Caulobacter segnis TaxID=88688 RepID=A0A2W5V3V3_9CAUL|nr:NAD-dependent succinate-semialdehyde dehydrogenase [Caulobacter segnis]PZR34490.1 MAG: succinate-semialdehyde dehydrogenase (NADP(+)) [Caulobacter segnis]